MHRRVPASNTLQFKSSLIVITLANGQKCRLVKSHVSIYNNTDILINSWNLRDVKTNSNHIMMQMIFTITKLQNVLQNKFSM